MPPIVALARRKSPNEDQYRGQCAAGPCATSMEQPLPPPRRAFSICFICSSALCDCQASCCRDLQLRSVSFRSIKHSRQKIVSD